MIQWYAIYTRPRAEKKVFERLTEQKQEVFLPLVTRIRQWKDRKKKVDMPLFPSYLFIHFDYKNRFDILPTDGIVKIVNFKGQPAVIPDWQIEALKKMLEHPETLRLENYIRPGELVEVVEGSFKGVRGTVKQIRGETRLLVSIDGIRQSVSVEIEAGFVKRLEKELHNG
ncbi:MAG TPA: UpxY family transcription antiterminator [Caldithrix abyssi]|uniref:UpxY family transcription antiterminator n=1 Tax=Caldithrix abyssi TaxID=187145 RepID=A0A7V5UEM5_CALAY|nr:UpxY family transcription antiterminator [Caldithrix abyssi]